MKKTLLIACLASFCAFSFGISARLPSPGMVPAEKILRSEIVLVAEATGRYDGPPPLWPNQNLERLRVIQVIKGKDVPASLMFVTSGLSGETSARCCDPGGRYLIFLNRGYPVMEEDSKGFKVVLKEAEKYVSGADGAFSAYKICDDKVLGWPNGGDGSVSFQQVQKAIRETRVRVRFKSKPAKHGACC